jgi:hypothetical protein
MAEGLATRAYEDADVPAAVAAAMWEPAYLPVEPASEDQAVTQSWQTAQPEV